MTTPPAQTDRLIGHDEAERALLQALHSGRLHHAWLISGPEGIGKATLAYRFARFLLSRPLGEPEPAGLFGETPEPAAPETLAVDPDHPTARRIAGGAHANLRVIERSWDDKRKIRRNEIVVADIRAAQAHFTATAGEGGWRVAIVDSADAMNRSAANALLKTLEEPPRDSVLLLIAHAPGRLLPTIRSRCRHLKLRPLPVDQVAQILTTEAPDLADADRFALARLSDGSPGRALALHEAGGLDVYRAMVDVLAGLPQLDRVAAHDLANRLSGKAADMAYRTFTQLLFDWVSRMVRTAARGAKPAEIVPGERAAMQRLSASAGLDRWVEVWEKMTALVDRAEAVNLDRKQVILSLLETLAGTAAGPARR